MVAVWVVVFGLKANVVAVKVIKEGYVVEDNVEDIVVVIVGVAVIEDPIVVLVVVVVVVLKVEEVGISVVADADVL